MQAAAGCRLPPTPPPPRPAPPATHHSNGGPPSVAPSPAGPASEADACPEGCLQDAAAAGALLTAVLACTVRRTRCTAESELRRYHRRAAGLHAHPLKGHACPAPLLQVPAAGSEQPPAAAPGSLDAAAACPPASANGSAASESAEHERPRAPAGAAASQMQPPTPAQHDEPQPPQPQQPQQPGAEEQACTSSAPRAHAPQPGASASVCSSQGRQDGELEALQDAAWLTGGGGGDAQQAVQAAWVSQGRGWPRLRPGCLQCPMPAGHTAPLCAHRNLCLPPAIGCRPRRAPSCQALHRTRWPRCPACGCCHLAAAGGRKRQARCWCGLACQHAAPASLRRTGHSPPCACWCSATSRASCCGAATGCVRPKQLCATTPASRSPHGRAGEAGPAPRECIAPPRPSPPLQPLSWLPAGCLPAGRAGRCCSLTERMTVPRRSYLSVSGRGQRAAGCMCPARPAKSLPCSQTDAAPTASTACRRGRLCGRSAAAHAQR